MTTSRALSPHELSYNLLAHRPRIAEAINRLNGKNLIVKTPQKLDRRYSRITLTEEGLNTAQLGETELRKACFTAISRNLKNLIVKTPQKLDRRYSRITLTEEGLNTAQLGETELRKACFTAISRNLNSKEFNLTVDIAKTCIEDIHRQNPGCF